MKYRKKPEDFIVEEIADHKILSKGEYKLYTLEKEGIETFTLIESISKNNNIPRKDISLAGMKDTHAKTKQYLTIPKKYEVKNLKNAKIEFLGYLENPIRLGNLTGNRFIITVREIEKKEIDQILKNSETIRFGLPNYYDSQRFGNVNNKQFIIKHVIKKDYESAVKQYLTNYTPYEREQIKTDKKNILASWPAFNIKVQNYELRRIIDEYKKTKKWTIVYKKISPPLRELFVSSYQSYLWNECVKMLLKKQLDKNELFSVPYVMNELIFFKKEIKDFPKTFQKISHKISPKEYEKETIKKVLEKEELKIQEFNIRQSGNFFKTDERDILFYPKDFEMGKPIKEGQTYSITLKFTLPKGSYATLVLKKIFGK